MVRQIPSSNVAETALKNSCSYFTWLCQESGIDGPLARLFYETDFRWVDGVADDENRAKEAKDLREQYAIFLIAGSAAEAVVDEAQWRDIDILKKSILGPACVFEVLVCLARNMNDLMNIDPEPKVKEYFGRLMMNVGFDFYDEEDWDDNSQKVEKYWTDLLNRVLDRAYLPDGEGGLFPVEDAEADLRELSLWDQMNLWTNEQMELI